MLAHPVLFTKTFGGMETNKTYIADIICCILHYL